MDALVLVLIAAFLLFVRQSALLAILGLILVFGGTNPELGKVFRSLIPDGLGSTLVWLWLGLSFVVLALLALIRAERRREALLEAEARRRAELSRLPRRRPEDFEPGGAGRRRDQDL